uniref:N-acetylaspartate synthetase n=1 Tax=Neogobius melanostomus TaxID=47308 RepID=A0A8C6TJG5_9GOBI
MLGVQEWLVRRAQRNQHSPEMRRGAAGKTRLLVRECEPRDEPEVRRIFIEGMMEMIEDTAIRGLPHHPDSLLLYGALTVACLWLSSSWWMLVLVPMAVLIARFWFSHQAVHRFTKHYLRTDMADIQGSYINTQGSCLWVAEVEGAVVGHVSAVQISDHTVELQRMSVDLGHRHRGVAVALGRRFVKFAQSSGFSKAIVGTTDYRPASHKLYLSLGFRWVSVTNGYRHVREPDGPSLLDRVFYHVSYHHYEMELLPENNADGKELF